MRAPGIGWSFHSVSPDDAEDAPFTLRFLEKLSAHWTVVVLGLLERHGCLRYHEIQAASGGITQRMLTKALRQLERDGLVSRRKFVTFPPRVDYELTELGRGLAAEMRALRAWVRHHAPQLRAAQETFDARPPQAPPQS